MTDTAPQNRSWFTRLSRITTSGRLIPEIDGLRFIAIGSVVLYHVNTDYAKYLEASGRPVLDAAFRVAMLGQYGVQLFFAISGFILGLPFATQYLASGRQVSLRAYFLRRLTRLEPPYLLNIFLFFFLKTVVAAQARSADLLPDLLASTIYMHNQVFGFPSLVNSVTWSLEIEVQFYLLAPLLALVFRIRSVVSRRATILGVMLVAGIPQAVVLVPARYYYSLLFFLPYFAVGFLLADLYVTDWRGAPRRASRWDFVAIATIPLMLFAASTPFTRGLLFPATILLLYIAAFRGTTSSAILRLKPVTVIGGMCYTIYLYHTAVIKLLGPRVFGWRVGASYAANLGFQMLVVGLPVLLLSTVLFIVIERPCMFPDWPARLAARLTGRRVQARAIRPS